MNRNYFVLSTYLFSVISRSVVSFVMQFMQKLFLEFLNYNLRPNFFSHCRVNYSLLVIVWRIQSIIINVKTIVVFFNSLHGEKIKLLFYIMSFLTCQIRLLIENSIFEYSRYFIYVFYVLYVLAENIITVKKDTQ